MDMNPNYEEATMALNFTPEDMGAGGSEAWHGMHLFDFIVMLYFLCVRKSPTVSSVLCKKKSYEYVLCPIPCH